MCSSHRMIKFYWETFMTQGVHSKRTTDDKNIMCITRHRRTGVLWHKPITLYCGPLGGWITCIEACFQRIRNSPTWCWKCVYWDMFYPRPVSPFGYCRCLRLRLALTSNVKFNLKIPNLPHFEGTVEAGIPKFKPKVWNNSSSKFDLKFQHSIMYIFATRENTLVTIRVNTYWS